MRSFISFIPFILLLSFPLFAEQAKLRTDRPFQVTVFPVYRPYFTFAYNSSENLSIGFAMASGGKFGSSETVSTGGEDCLVPDFLHLAVCEKSVSFQPSGHLFFNYFPFEFPFFVGLIAGRSGGSTTRYLEYASFDNPSLELSRQAPVVYTVTEEARYYAGPGAGVRFVLDSGVVFSGEFWLASNSAYQNRVLMGHDLRGLSGFYAPLSPEVLWLSQRWLEGSLETRRITPALLLHVGFSF